MGRIESSTVIVHEKFKEGEVKQKMWLCPTRHLPRITLEIKDTVMLDMMTMLSFPKKKSASNDCLVGYFVLTRLIVVITQCTTLSISSITLRTRAGYDSKSCFIHQ